jgi:simple sugar transport system ATP-binding protein
MVSDELDDLRHCDRVLVMVHGRVAAEFPAGPGTPAVFR